MAIIKKALTAREHKAALHESYNRMQRWYRINQFARDIHRALNSDEAVDTYIRNGRHELAAMIPPRGDIE